MPNPGDYDNQEEWTKACIPVLIGEGKDQDQAAAVCAAMWRDKEQAAKYRLSVVAVKAVGDWEIDITALPYNVSDSDGQWFDPDTDTMTDSFNLPAIFYHHGVKPGGGDIDEKPVIIGKALSAEKRPDGLHIRAILDKANEYARRVWEAIKNGYAAVSSDSIAHLARLDIGGKRIMYEKSRPGRIAVWPLAGVSLWDAVDGNLRPASRNAVALPAMKAIYREAGLQFPELENDTTGDGQAEKIARRRAEIIRESKNILSAVRQRKYKK